MAFILGTAGHIDHGKTSLVQTLSGVNCDKLKEEQVRGITIETGFVELKLPNGKTLSIIDVPGHEKFIKNMVAGVVGIQAVLFVISAEEGIMPQTREHLEIISLLGINKGIIVLTKIDGVEKDWLDLIESQVKEFFSTTVFASAPIVKTSSKTREGIDILIEKLTALEKTIEHKNNAMPFRLPLDRVFTVHGHGTVVTGSVISGEVFIQDSLQVYPSLQLTKAKNIHNHNKKQEKNGTGTRTAINVYNIDHNDIRRGDILAMPNTLILSRIWEVELTCLENSPVPIRHRGQIHFHHYTKDVLARVHCLDKGTIEAGKTAICHIYFEENMVGVAGDRCIIRSCSPLKTIAGCRVLNPLNRVDSYLAKKHKNASLINVLQKKERDNNTIKKIILSRLSMVEEKGLSLLELSLLVNIAQDELVDILQALIDSKEVVCIDNKNPVYISFATFQQHSELMRIFILKIQEEQVHGLNKGVPLSYLSMHYQPKLSENFLSFLIKYLLEKKIIEKRGDSLFDTSQVSRLNKKEEAFCNGLLKIYKEAGLMPPSNSVIQEQFSCGFKELLTMLSYLKEEGTMVRIMENYWCYAPHIEDLKNKIYLYFESNSELTIADFKNIFGNISRKYIVYLLEYLDAEKVTLRINNSRVLRK